ncbi:CidA/LrgA family protein [Paenibacillus graminis]|uniref:Membrane protein n=1 Tax=Paenibacillus graminis TaxID=189425 RepID=A0A089MA27_9BACL|nr:CidA/LrgA family holin-like protein [Paenibacillus graminis]AIQ68348.1 membrane protein [Paenibacillus graminis]MEC0169321.1 CidA/LrgA family holin-like protein [Paenibacillus graminis]
MKIIRIIAQVAVLYIFFLAGDYLQKLMHLPVPGSIVGLLLLFILLLFKIVPVKLIEDGSLFILAYLPMFFIPATAGIMNHLDIFSGRGLMMIGILVASSVLTMVVTAHATEWITVRRTGSRSRSKITVVREKGSEA